MMTTLPICASRVVSGYLGRFRDSRGVVSCSSMLSADGGLQWRLGAQEVEEEAEEAGGVRECL